MLSISDKCLSSSRWANPSLMKKFLWNYEEAQRIDFCLQFKGTVLSFIVPQQILWRIRFKLPAYVTYLVIYKLIQAAVPEKASRGRKPSVEPRKKPHLFGKKTPLRKEMFL